MRLGANLKIKFEYFKSNLLLLGKIAPHSKTLLMVKANGYGHGMVPITKYALEECSVESFGVATLSEAIFLRQSIQEKKFDIYIFSENHLTGQLAELYRENSLIPVISSIEELSAFLKNSQFSRVPLSLKFNTGMNRLGLLSLDIDTVIKLIKESGRSEIFHLMTHFARSSESVQKVHATYSQFAEFNILKQKIIDSNLKVLSTSVSNSGAIEQSFGIQETYIRPGLMAYGPSSLAPAIRAESAWKGKNISALEVQVLRKFSVKKGTAIGYGGTEVPQDGFICILAIGYGDGFSTKLQNVKLGHISGQPVIFGRINMDMTQIFYGNKVNEREIPNEGELVNLWGHDPSQVLSLSDQSGIIPYELFCNLNTRVARNYTF